MRLACPGNYKGLPLLAFAKGQATREKRVRGLRHQCMNNTKKRMSYDLDRTFIPHKHFQRKKPSKARTHLLGVQLRNC